MASLNKSATQANQRFERLVAPLRLDLMRFALWLSKDRCLAEEVVQETLFRAWRSFDKLKDERCLKSWLLTIARREHARHYEGKTLDMKCIDDLNTSDSHFLSVRETTDVHDMRAAILALDAIYREPLILQVVLGFSMKEIASSMGVSGATVATRLHRARHKLIETNLRSEIVQTTH